MPNRILDTSFYSQALRREMPYLIVLPEAYDHNEQRYPVLYLLHGWNGDYRNWCTLTKLTEYASRYQFLVVTPEGQNSWYVNSATSEADRFYDYLSHDLIAEIDTRYRTIPSREKRAMAGLSMGGYGSFLVSLKQPELFCMVGSVSGAFNAPIGIEEVLPDVRPNIELAYGEDESLTRRENNVFSLLQDPPPGLPFYFMQCGTEDALLPANRLLIAELAAKRIPYEYHELAGDHTWDFWDATLPPLLQLAQKFFGS